MRFARATIFALLVSVINAAVISSANTDSSIGLVKRSPNEEDDSSDPHALEREVEAMKSRVESLGSQIAQLKHNYCGVKHSLVIVCKNSVAVQNMLDKEQNPEKQVVLAKKIKKMERLKQKYKDELDGISKFINDVSASYTHLKQNFERIGATPSTHLYVDEQLDPKTYTCGTEDMSTMESLECGTLDASESTDQHDEAEGISFKEQMKLCRAQKAKMKQSKSMNTNTGL
ncbi:hypothetical protein BASA50_002564 [Batrachochytrium salamandrivorans]|uniref:Uncharacterized protein n=1 Tax=Batrachochytrium salamandrivorans TaxID=1357716 RepID=A0ABQ8FKZ9_9FUNG|nr:hypothetical protein BASA50_002564 [Batrachochytrium salamandrivorans]KAH9276136.1 hypothetical protein BASA83_001410 [Batrachochytrium salamandrivorans]KAJ1330572.1 hypothetical protein BSLG_009334 [Batrachochytrium salamandrivorans]